MKTKFIEATGDMNWGKFLIGQFEEHEWAHRSAHPDSPFPLLRQRGWDAAHVLVLDVETGEGALFRTKGMPSADLEKHSIWVCPMYEPFLGWLYQQDLTDITKLPDRVEIPPEVARRHSALYGYRRDGGKQPLLDAVRLLLDSVTDDSPIYTYVKVARVAARRLKEIVEKLNPVGEE